MNGKGGFWKLDATWKQSGQKLTQAMPSTRGLGTKGVKLNFKIKAVKGYSAGQSGEQV